MVALRDNATKETDSLFMTRLCIDLFVRFARLFFMFAAFFVLDFFIFFFFFFFFAAIFCTESDKASGSHRTREPLPCPQSITSRSAVSPSFIGVKVQPIKYSSNKCDLNSVQLNSRAVPSYHAAHMLHVICTRLRLGHLSVRGGDSSRRSEEIVGKILDFGLSMRSLSSL